MHITPTLVHYVVELIKSFIIYQNKFKIKIINDTYNINEAKIKAKEKVKEKILQSLDKDEYILDEKTLNFYQKDSKIVLDMFITCYEEIGKEEKIEPITEE